MSSGTGRVVAHRSDTYRPDIEGLRGIAVLLVVIYHAGPFGVTGGFIGVDVFFVISGFLITGLLLRERERSGRIALGAFYARRMRRLLPASSVVILVTLLGSLVAVAPLDVPRVAMDGASAAVWVSNLRFATQGGYFAVPGEPSPFLHFWSLSVEEQFYLFWPVLLIAVTRLPHPRLWAGVLLAAITAGSFAWSVWLTDAAPDWAFYLLLTRAWELALGGLVAVALPWLARGGRLLGMLAWAGLAGVAWAGVSYTGDLAWPGTAAALPVAAAAALVLGGDRRWGPAAVLGFGPLRFTGRISYALYLWHWPLLVLPMWYLGGELAPASRLALVAIAILMATMSTLWLEEPIREGVGRLSPQTRRTLAGGVATIVLVVGASVAVAAVSGDAGVFGQGDGVTAVGPAPSDPPLDIDASPGASDDPVLVPPGASDDPLVVLPGDSPAPATPSPQVASPAPTPSPPPTAHAPPIPPPGVPVIPDAAIHRPPPSPSPGPSPSSSIAPTATPTAAPTATPTPAPAASPAPAPAATPTAAPTATPTPRPERTPKATPVSYALPADVRPPLRAARDDEERLRSDGCLAFEPVRAVPDCVYGDRGGEFIVALVGDSHAAHWFPALERIAKARDWRLVVMTKVSCPFTLMPLRNTLQKRDYPECTDFVEDAIGKLKRLQPDLVITTQLRWFHPLRDADESPTAQGRAIGEALARVPGAKVVIVDTPWGDQDAPACLSRNRGDVRPCAVPRSMLTWGGVPEREKAAAKVADAALLDFSRVLCDRSSCPVAADGFIRYRDDHHLTASFARSLAPVLDKALQRVLAAADD